MHRSLSHRPYSQCLSLYFHQPTQRLRPSPLDIVGAFTLSTISLEDSPLERTHKVSQRWHFVHYTPEDFVRRRVNPSCAPLTGSVKTRHFVIYCVFSSNVFAQSVARPTVCQRSRMVVAESHVNSKRGAHEGFTRRLTKSSGV